MQRSTFAKKIPPLRRVNKNFKFPILLNNLNRTFRLGVQISNPNRQTHACQNCFAESKLSGLPKILSAAPGSFPTAPSRHSVACYSLNITRMQGSPKILPCSESRPMTRKSQNLVKTHTEHERKSYCNVCAATRMA